MIFSLHLLLLLMYRQKRSTLPADPRSLEDLSILEDWKTTRGPNPRQFLIYDNGPESLNRILVFSSEAQLRHLTLSDLWYADGNFSSAPTLFTQLYVIRAALGDTAVSCVYAFLPGLTLTMYIYLISLLNFCKAYLLKIEIIQIIQVISVFLLNLQVVVHLMSGALKFIITR